MSYIGVNTVWLEQHDKEVVDKVLDKLVDWVKDNWMPLGNGEYEDGGLLDKIEEIRQKVGE